jgi:hypothetical protein
VQKSVLVVFGVRVGVCFISISYIINKMSGRGNSSINPKKGGMGRLQQEVRKPEAREQAELKARIEQKAREEAELKAKKQAELKAKEQAELKAREEAKQKAIEEAKQKDRLEAEQKAREQEEQEAREYCANGWTQRLYNCERCGNLGIFRRCDGICDPEREASWLLEKGAREEALQKYREQKAREQEERKARKQAVLKAKEQEEKRMAREQEEKRMAREQEEKRMAREQEEKRIARECSANGWAQLFYSCELCGIMGIFRRCDGICDPERKAKWLLGQGAREEAKQERRKAIEEAERKAREQEAREQEKRMAREQEELKAREQAAREQAEKEAEKHAKELPKILAQNTFIKYCKDGDLETAKSLLETVNIRDVYRNALFQAVENGHIEIVKLLCDKLYNEYPGESRGYTSYNWHAFTLACDSGHMELAKHLVDDLRLDVSVGNDEPALIAACAKGHLEIAQWIASQNKYISTSTYASSLKEACEHGHIDVAKWIFQVEYLDKIYDYPRRLSNYNIADGFFESCLNGRLDIVQWLFPIMNADRKLTSKLENSFSIAGGYREVPKHPEVVNWLLQQRPDLAI